ncbi:hypothetical protein ACFC08_28775 [Streptomyces sp. NPDC056112]|uniref:hypothetical protein n=1 Tax=Streptomyces sp. NPDC056112 TaxID=3345715 RepID=UPI0035DFBE42
MTTRDYPDYVSFTDAAALIVQRGLVGSMTPRGLRYMAGARLSKEIPPEQRWPFGDEAGQEPYLRGGRTRMMRTDRLLEYLEKYPPTGRGPARKARAAGAES